MRREQPTEETDPSRVAVPLSRAFYLSALSGSVFKGARKFGVTIEQIINHLRDGTYDEAVMTTTLGHGDNWKVDVCISGEWYRVELYDI